MRLSSKRVSPVIFAAVCALLGACTSAGDDGASAQPIASGTLAVLVGGDAVYYQIRLSDGTIVPLNLNHAKVATKGKSGEPIDWKSASGSLIDVFGARNADGGIDVDLMRPAEGVAETSDAFVVAGKRKLLVIPIQFDHGPLLADMRTIQKAAEATKAYFASASFGRMQMSYRLLDPVNVPLEGLWKGKIHYHRDRCTDANVYGWMEAAKKGAQAAMDEEGEGERVDAYQHIMLVQPLRFLPAEKPKDNPVPVCVWSGLGSLPSAGGVQSLSWIQSLDSMIHELGHNLGLQHANALTCTAGKQTVAMSDMCTSTEFGDPFDPMGWGGKRSQYNASYKAKLGWIPPSQIATARRERTYTLAPSAVASDGLQLLRVQGPGNIMYNVEFGGYDYLGSFLHQVFIRAVDAGSSRTFLLDTHPGGTDAIPFLRSGLRSGESFKLFGTSVTLTVESVSRAGAQIKVSDTDAANGGNPAGR